MKKLFSVLLLIAYVFMAQNISAQCGDARYTFVVDSSKTVNFTNTTIYNFHTYSWNFGDGQTSTTKSPSHKYNQSGKYWIELRGTDTIKNCYDTTGKWISIGCASSFTYSSDGTEFSYYSTNPGAVKVRYSFGDGSTSSNSSGIHTYANFGTYNVCLAVYCTTTDSAKSCQSVTIKSNCVAAFDIVNKDSIGKTKFTFINRSTTSSAMRYLWDLGDGTTATTTGIYERPYSGGTYNICLTISDTSKNCSDSICQTLVVSNCFLSLSSYSRADTLFYNYTGNASNIKIDFGDGKSTTAKSGQHIYSLLGKYFLCLRAYCSANDSPKICKFITLTKIPCMAKFTKSIDTSKKYKLFLINQSTNTPTTTYLWDFGDGVSSTLRNPSHKYTSFGKFKVCLTVKDSACSIIRCDTIGLDSSGKLLKKDGFDVEVIEFTASIKNNKSKTDFKVFPNPAGNQLNIDLLNSSTQYNKIEVMNSVGQMCINQVIQSGNTSIALDLRLLQPGLYFIRLSNESESGFSKFIKN
jgi:PKD repeat protein